MGRNYRRKKPETYLVNITVLEGRHYAMQNMNSLVQLKVGKQKAVTRVRHGTDAPFYNEYFSFQFDMDLDLLLDVTIFLTVIRPRSFCKRRKVLGYCALDVGTVYGQPDHQFYQKWAILSSYKGNFSGVRGYLKVTISILGKDEVPKIPLINPLSDNDIEGNLLLPKGVLLERQRAFFIFRIYRAYDIVKRNFISSSLEEPIQEKKLSQNEKLNLPKVYVKVSFAGVTGKSIISTRTAFPVFNQSITISEMYPALAQRIQLQLIYKHYGKRKVVLKKYLRISSISSVSQGGFLPTFGPAYVHFYNKNKTGEEYAGKVLLSLETKVFAEGSNKTRIATIDDIPPIFEGSIWESENVLLFMAILNVSIIDKRYSSQPISFELNWGRMKLIKSEDMSEKIIVPHITTSKYKPKTKNRQFWYLDIKEQVPCLHVIDVYPSVRRRLYRANLIDQIVTNMENRLDLIEKYFFSDEFVSYSHQIESKLIEFFDYVSSACQKFIDIQSTKQLSYNTELDILKSQYMLYEVEEVKKIANNAYNPRMKKKSFRKGQKITKRLKILIDHPQECWPNIYLWLRCGNQKMECLKLEPRHLVHSAIPEEQGKYCGNVNNLQFITQRYSTSLSPVVCQIEIYTWLGLERQKEECFKNVPPGYEFPENYMDNIPEAHIYQGRFLLAFDFTGLSDFFAKVIIHDQVKQTMHRPQTLNPIWDETLIFRNIIIYGTKEHVKAHPPSIVLEINDKDNWNKVDYVGFALVTPKIKFKDENYGPPNFPPKLEWHHIENDQTGIGDVLAVFEFLEDRDDGQDDLLLGPEIRSIPVDIRPNLIKYRIEVYFWGVRNLKKLNHSYIKHPKVVIECNENKLHSEVAKICQMNFHDSVKRMDLELPDMEDFLPPIMLKLFDCRNFGRFVYAGTHLAYMKQFFYHPITKSNWDSRMSKPKKSFDSMQSQPETISLKLIKEKQNERMAHFKWRMQAICSKENIVAQIKSICRWIWCCGLCKFIKRRKKKKLSKKDKKAHEKFLKAQDYMVQDTRIAIDIDDEEVLDWWSKYFNSLDDPEKSVDNEYDKNFRIKVYNDELENQPEFENFQDMLAKYKIYRGKTTGDEFDDEKARVGTLKCKIRVYPWDETETFYHYVNPAGLMLRNGFFQDTIDNDVLNFTVRVYCVRAIKLRPTDRAGACDSYVAIKMGNITISDKKNYVPKSTNPFYGKCFELVGSFPKDHEITLSIYDWDRSTHTDLIGATVIDIENRYYTKHRAHCGLQYDFSISGPTPWRDQVDPSAILSELCLRNNLQPPEYGDDYIYVAGQKFSLPVNKGEEAHHYEANQIIIKENLALNVLHNWQKIPVVGCHLVPDHIETRSLYNKDNPGIEQGKVQLWVDIFTANDLPIPHKVNIKTRAPISYELRVIIWNTDSVLLNEDDFFGDRKSDIYVKGWVTNPSEAQETDVHYRSMTGEGNFNWRFVFTFDYLQAENMIVERKKQKMFDLDETERKMPCRLTLQVWDNDIFSRDDFLGSLTLYLSKFPRGAKYARQCTLRILDSAPRINLFKIKRTRGWWPFQARGDDNKHTLAGKVEAEFELITSEQANVCPAGMGREPPTPLPPPKRPESSFNWILNPFKTCKFIIWKNLKWKLLKFFFILLFVLFLGLFLYNVPGYSVKKFLGV